MLPRPPTGPAPCPLQRGVVCVFLPRNTDLRALAAAVPPGWVWEVQRCYVNAKLKGVSLFATPPPQGGWVRGTAAAQHRAGSMHACMQGGGMRVRCVSVRVVPLACGWFVWACVLPWLRAQRVYFAAATAHSACGGAASSA